MKLVGIFEKSERGVGVSTGDNFYHLHSSQRTRELKNWKDRTPVEFILMEEGCPFDYTSRCTSGKCDCHEKIFAKVVGFDVTESTIAAVRMGLI